MSNGQGDEHLAQEASREGAEQAAAPPDDSHPLIFISHKHDDSVLAEKLVQWINDVTGGHVHVFSSSDAWAEKPTIGENLHNELAQTLSRAGIVLLLYTYYDHDWSYCTWECGVALNPLEPDTRIICLQCLEHGPRFQKDRVRAIVGDEQSMIDFAREFGNPEFYPGHSKPLSGLKEPLLVEKGQQLHQALVGELPTEPLENWSAWPFIRLEVPLMAVRELEAIKDNTLRVEKGKEVLENYCGIKDASESALRLFGKNMMPPDSSFSSLLAAWKDRDLTGDDAWLYTLAQQLVDAAMQDVPNIKEWARFRQVNGGGEHVLIIGRVKRRVAGLIVDCYFCRIVDVLPVSSIMNREQYMYYKDLDDLDPSAVRLKDLLAEMGNLRRTRLPILAEGKAKMIIHASMIDRFVRTRAFEGIDVETLTMEDLLNDESMRDVFEKSYIFVDKDTTVHAATALLNAAKGCQDIFVTSSGTESDPVLGWVCDRDLILEN
ncbi:MAG: hypothetical protein AAGE01_02630 [Pseudomonadota bacterium]